MQTLPGQVHSQSCGFRRPAECWGRAVPGAGGRRDPSPHPTPPPRFSSSFPGSPPPAPPSPVAGQPIPAALLPGCSGWWHGARRRLGELELCAQRQVRCAGGSGSRRAFLKPSSRSLKTDASGRPGACPAAGPASPRRRPPRPARARRGAGFLEAPLARDPDVLPREGLSQVNKDQLLKTLHLCFICKMVMVSVFMQRYSAPAAGGCRGLGRKGIRGPAALGFSFSVGTLRRSLKLSWPRYPLWKLETLMMSDVVLRVT